MAKQLNVNLSFNADTKQAKAEIEALSKALQTIAKMPGKASSLFDDTEIKKASQAALELQQHLSKAVNTDTGKLDLSRFSSSLKASNKDLSTYCNTLLKTGQQGQQAFLQLAKAIASADTPVTRVNKKLAEMGTTLKNTARWQISSSILHGFMGSIQSAYGYAQDLNKSLNDIRIVTGQNIEQMSKFAVEANRAAKALSTTTTDYTNASLIYFQQGLDAEEVAKRTEVTVKMANAAGVSAQVASDQLTAVWNNFYDGSKSLEYYADVMTALGAATASSTDEIAGGLEKFAAIGETIGLSYEYAASALATITSNTRQSEEVVGTALKTIFARIQGLNLGETLDDGTTLNKYSAALEKVGISIFEQNGEIKKMDDLLDEMASKWGTLAKDQQIALAQTVAGVRQYTQLVALMDNWNAGDSDSMIANLDTSYNASGALQEQADIYAESWEAAQDRVRAAAENIYDSLINDEFFIDILNGFEHILESVGGLVDGLGGLKGVIGVIGSIFLTNFAQKMPATLENLRQNLMVFTGQAQKEMVKVQNEMSAKMAVQASAPGTSESFKTQAEAILQVAKMKQKLILESKNLTSQEKEAYETRIKNVEAMYDEAIALAQVVEEQKKKAQTSADNLAKNASKDIEGLYSSRDQAGDQRDSAERIKTAAEKDGNNVEMERQAQAVKEAEAAMDDYNAKISDAIATYKKLGIEIVKVNENGEEVFDTSKSKEMAAAVKKVTDEYKQQVTQWKQLEVLQDDMSGQIDHWKQNAAEIDKSEEAVKDLKIAMAGYRDAITTIAAQNDIAFDETELQALNAALQDPKTSAVDCAAAFEKFKQSIDEKLTSKMNSLNASIEESSDTLEKLGLSTTGLGAMKKSAEEAAEGVTKLTLSTGNIKGQVDKGIDSTFKMSVALTQFGATAMSVSTMLNSINSAINIFKDEGATGLEKFGAAISIVTAAMSAYNSVTALSNTLLKSRAMAEMTATLMTKLGIAAKVSETGAVVTNTAAWYANPIMWIALIIVGVVAALAALVAVIGAVSKALADAYNADAIAAEKAENAAKNLGEAYNTVKQEYEDMIAAMENYQSARDALDELTKGTKEYEDALKEANRAAMELINKYGLIEGEHYKWDGNELVINEDAMDKVITSKEAEADEAYAASQMANANAKSARTQANLTEARRGIRDDNGLGDGDLVWKALGTTVLNSIIPGVGSLVMANEVMKSAEMDANIAKAVEEAKTNQNLFDTKEAMAEALDIDINDDKLIDALWANQEEIKSLAQEMNAAEAAWKLAAQNSANEILSNNEVVQNSNNTEEVMAAGGKVYGAAYDEAYNKYLSDAQSRGLFNTGTDASKAAFEEYAKKAGLDQLKNFEVTNYKGDGTVEYKYIDEEGKEQVKLATAEEIAATLAAAEAATQLGASAEKLVGIFNTLDNSGNEAAQALKNIVAYGDVEKATRAEFQDLQEEYENADDKTAYLNEVFGGADGVIDEEELKALGYESIEALQAGVEEAIENGEDAWRDVGKSLTDTARTAFKNSMKSGMFDDLTLEQTNQMANLFKEAFENGGVEGLNSLQSNLSVMFEKSGKDASEMATILGNVDWQTTNIEDLTAMLEEAGIETDEFADELANLIELMQEGQNIGFDGAAEIYKTAHEIINGLETGDIISSEDYENLKTMGINMSDYFVQMADGSYKLTADAKEFYDMVNSKSLEQFQNNIQNLTQQKNDVNSLQNSGYTKDSIATMETKGVWGSIVQDNSKLGDQLTFLKAIGSDLENLDSYIQEVENGGQLTQRQLREIRTELEENAWQWDNLSQVTVGFDAEIQRNMDAYAMSATTVGDLNDMLREGLINAEAYNKAIDSVMDMEFEAEGLDVEAANDVADAFREMADAGEAGTEALKDNEEAVKDATVRYMELNEAITDIYDNYDDYIDVLKAARKASTPLEKANLLNEKSAKSLRTSLAGLLGTTEDLIDADLMAAINPADFEAAANGNVEAIDRIREAFIRLQIEGIDGITLDGLMAELNAFNDGAYIDLDNMPMLWSLIEAKVAAGATAADIEALLSGLNIDADVSDFYGTMEEMAAIAEQAGSRVVQATSFSQTSTTETEATPRTIDNVNFTETVTTTNHPSVAAVPMTNGFGPLIYGTNMVSYQKSVSVDPVSYQTQDTATATEVVTENAAGEEGKVRGIQINGAHKALPASRTPSPTNTTRKPVSSSGGGSKNEPKTSSAPSKMDKGDETHKSAVVKRYKEIDDSLDDLADSYERANREADKLFGVDKLKAIEKENKLLQEQQKLIEKKAKEAKKYMASDKAELDKVAKEAGLNFSYDEKGNITNYTDQMANLHNQLAAAENTYNNMVDEYNAAVDAAVARYGDELPEELAEQLETKQAAIEAYEENVLSKVRDTITSVEDAMALYEESKELYEELGLEAEDIANQIKDNNYRIISEGLELRITLNEDDLELIEYQLGKLEDDFYKMAESIAIMVGNGTANIGGDGTQLGEYIDNLNHYKNTMEELERAYAAGEITEASYVEGMKEVRSGMLENLQSIQELDNAMMNYYEETLTAGQEELDKYTEKIEHQTSVLEHYMSIMEILGKSQDYESLGVILEAQAKTIGNEAKVAKENYEMLQAQADAKKAAYEAASTPEEAELLKKEWEAAQVAANEAQDEMLSKTEEWAEAMTAVAQNKLKGLGQALEDALTASFGGSFDAMTTAMERANSLQEEYLTTTNQIYETNKLMHTAQKEIEKTSNDVAKRKMKDFITETKQLQDQTKLSQYELDIQKAKYDLLLAEIALEEAQSAKSTVRLQRDSEGNFGYVYTADKTAVDNAQQAFEDAQNNLYNIALEGTNNYTQKYQETLNEFYDTMTSLQEQHLNGEFQNEEEYQAAMQSAREFYYAKLQEYSSLNSIALSTDARVVEDAWTKEFRGMTQQTDLWMQNVDGYVRNVMGVFEEWQGQMAEIRKTTIGPDLVALKENTQEIVDASDALAEAVTKDGGVIDALEEEYNAVSKITGAYAKYRDIIADLIAQYDGFMGRINTTVNTAAGTGNSSPTPGPTGFASGGYTGEWGPGGKLAMLHQKELILKEGDTENFLASLEVLRNIVQVIDLHSMNAQLGGLLKSPQYHDYENGKEVLEQNVHIEANFPEVTDRYEIEAALTSIVNRASQFTNRK